MSQVADYSIANASGATVRADLNNVLAAIASANSGTAEPTTMYPFMIWVDTTNNLIKLRNGANDGWLTLPIAMNASNTAPSNLNVLGNLGVGSATTPAELIHAIASSGDANIRMEGTAVRLKKSGEDFIVYDGSNLKFETDGTEAARFDGNQRFGIGTSSPDRLIHITETTGGKIRLERDDTTLGAGNTVGLIEFETNDTDDAGVAATFSAVGESGAGAVGFQFTTGTASSNSERLRIDSSGKIGIGTSSPDNPLHVYHATTNGVAHFESGDSGVNISFSDSATTAVNYNTIGASGNSLTFASNGGERMRIDSSGNIGIGTVSPGTKVHINSGANSEILRIQGADAQLRIGNSTSNIIDINSSGSGDSLTLSTGDTERARITDGGALLVGTTSTTINTSNFGIALFADGRPKFSKNVTGGSHVMNVYGNAGEFRVYGDGDVQNTNNSYAGISDESVKENIVDATDKLEDLKQVQIRNYNLIDDDLKQIGVIAQELEPIFPGLIKECNETGIKAVKYSVFVPILIKAIQELEARVAELEAA